MKEIKLIKRVLVWISSNWFTSIDAKTKRRLVYQWTILVQRWIESQGILSTIKRIKFIRLIVTRYMSGTPLRVNDMLIGVNKLGFPKQIEFFQALIDSRQPDNIRFVLTCLNVSRAMKYNSLPDYGSITEPFSGSVDQFPQEFINIFVNDFVKIEPPSYPKPVESFFLNLKAGPQVGPALLAAHLSAKAFTGANLWGLATLIGPEAMDWFKRFRGNASISKHIVSNRKLHLINDPEAKCRIIAIYDYISQWALNPLSEKLFEVLKSIPQDRTFTQDPLIDKGGRIDSFHSLDLSSATDRFPRKLQQQILAEWWGPVQAAAWVNLLVNEPFRTPTGETIAYAVGQPMGARSSWAMFTLSHHCVVQYAAYLCGKYPFGNYILLGDDIVLWDDEVAYKYRELIKALGVNISEAKSHVSVDTYEFAKRWFQCGIEISPVPMKGLIENINQPLLIFSQIRELVYTNRGPRSMVTTLDLFNSFLTFFGDLFPKKMRRFLNSKAKWVHFVSRNINGENPLETREFLASATKHNEYPVPASESKLFDEFKRAGAGVVNGMAWKITNDLLAFHKKFRSDFDTFLKPLPDVPNVAVDTPTIENHPLTYSIYSSIKGFWEMSMRLNHTLNLTEQLRTVTLINLDKLQSGSRLSEELIFTHSSFGKEMFKLMQDDPDVIIAKARAMQFGHSLMINQGELGKAMPHLKYLKWN